MSDKLFYGVAALVGIGLIALSLVWPQGLGDRSPPPFGHTVVQRTPERQAAMRREAEQAARALREAQAAVRAAERPEQVTTPAPSR